MEKQNGVLYGLFMNNKVVVHCSSVSMPALIRNEESGTQTAHIKFELIGFDAGMRNEPTDEPSVGSLNRENFAASTLTPSMNRPQVLILGQHPNLVRPVRPTLQDFKNVH